MHEYWFCGRCKSVNMGHAQHCYKCHSPIDDAAVATAAKRPPGVVLTPGLDEQHRAVAWTLMSQNLYVSAWRLGYAAAGMIMLTLAITVFAIAVVAVTVARGGSLDFGGAAPDRLSLLGATLLALGLSAIVTFCAHSIFLGLTSMNSPALGSGSPLFGPVRFGLWWIECVLWLCWGVLTCYGIQYVARARLVFFDEIGPGPIESIGRPTQPLRDLTSRLGVPMANDTRLVGIWTGAWTAICGLVYALAVAPFLGLVLFIVVAIPTAATAGNPGVSRLADQMSSLAAILGSVAVAALVVAAAFALLTMARITTDLSNRQRVRERWIRSERPVHAQEPRPVGDHQDPRRVN